MTKYKSKKCPCGYGHVHDSKKEAKRCDELHVIQRAGLISELETQVKFELIPSRKYADMPNERAVNYIADFVYKEGGKVIVEDVKGVKTKDYVIKRKMFKDRFCEGGDVVFREA